MQKSYKEFNLTPADTKKSETPVHDLRKSVMVSLLKAMDYIKQDLKTAVLWVKYH